MNSLSKFLPPPSKISVRGFLDEEVTSIEEERVYFQ